MKKWLERKTKEGVQIEFGEEKLDLEKAIRLANGSFKKLKDKDIKSLSSSFAGGDAKNLNERLAWIMSSRTVFNAPPPSLWLGTVVSWASDIEEQYLLCMRPRCDFVRLKAETTFLFLPLSPPRKRGQQIVVRAGNQFKRFAIGLDPGGWVLRRFSPSKEAGSVTATKSGDDDRFQFTDSCSLQYMWLGELKAEYAQRIAQAFAADVGRIAVDESEWLRRVAKLG